MNPRSSSLTARLVDVHPICAGVNATAEPLRQEVVDGFIFSCDMVYDDDGIWKYEKMWLLSPTNPKC